MRRQWLASVSCGVLLSVGSVGGESTVLQSKGDAKVLEMAYSAESFVDIGLGDAQAATAVWADALMQKWDLPFSSETLVFDDPQEVVKAIRDEQIDIVVLPPLQYVQIVDQVDIQPVLVSEAQGEVSHPLVLLVRRDLGAVKLADLVGGDLVVALAGKGRIGRLWLEQVLADSGFAESRAFFSHIREVGKTAQAVLPVFLGEIDACLVPREQFETMVELNPQLDRKLMVVATSPAFCQTLVCVRANFDTVRRQLLIQKFQEIHSETLGRQILTLFRVERLVPFDASSVEATFALIRESQRHE